MLGHPDQSGSAAANPGERQIQFLPPQGEVYPTELADRENPAIQQRRLKACGAVDPGPVVGLALSGGGIRSATFSLGVLQSLASLGLLRRIDFISSVSGGGYIGSFLGGLFVRAPELDSENPGSTDFVEKVLSNPRSRPLSWLRENGRYLTPGGSGDSLLAASVVIRNWAALQLVLGVFVLMLVLLMGLLRVWVHTIGGFEASSFFVAGMVKGLVWWSPYLALPVLVMGAWVIPMGWAYWLVSPPRSWTHQSPPFLTAVALVGGSVWGLQHRDVMVNLLGHSAIGILWGLQWVGGLALVAYVGVSVWALIRTRLVSLVSEDPILGPRQRLSDLLRLGIAMTLLSLLLAAVDSLGQTLYAFWVHKAYHPTDLVTWKQFLSVFSPLVALMGFGQKLLQYRTGKGNPAGWIKKLPLDVIALAVAVILGVLFLSLFSFVGHGIAWGWHLPAGDPGGEMVKYLNPAAPASSPFHFTVTPSDQLSWLKWGLGITALLSWAFGHTFEFLNQSSMGPFYTAMLTRAYVGASNPRRKESAAHHVVLGDDIPFSQYAPHEQGGPLHLINVTLNETCGGRSQVDQRDRHGLGMAVGPAGVTVGVRHHATWEIGDEILRAQGGLTDRFGVFRVRNPQTPFAPEPLGVGQWIGISGAAVSTGMGSNTSLGFSLLCGFFNVRLGHWWRSGVDPARRVIQREMLLPWARSLHRRLFAVQFHFMDEFLARLPGTSRQNWYLSDGGHFENTGVYELIRRRVPLIFLCDNGEDAGCRFRDLTNLVRKARVDFGAEIRVLGRGDLSNLFPSGNSPFGTLDDFKETAIAGAPGLTGPHAAMAAVYYDHSEKAGSIIVLLKPSLTGDESLDVMKYRETHPGFPQESTADQFFDEAQWESYRKLGEHLGNVVFPATSGGGTWDLLEDLRKRLPERA